ncbi:MAG TPA: sigma-70 family RNA polymerase sigma factor [Gaiellaceae bacterium]|nr:sigma-70 family RNA polymerase sigma factor [Gaiellaceae bacterium]
MTPLLAYRVRHDVDGSFEAVYRTHLRDVYGFALGILGNPDDAEDVTQTTFMNAYRALRRGERVQNLRAWLLAIAHNVCRQRFRTAARRPQEVELDAEAAEAYAAEDAPTAEEIRNAIAKLGFNQRAVLVLREIEGLSYEEIAQTMGVSLSAVETLLFRARQAMREQLEAAEHDLGCDAVQRLISLQLDGKLSRADRGLLRAHLRGCAECSRFARSQRARKRAMPGLVAAPLPAGLSGLFGGGASLVTAKAAAIAASAALVGASALVETGVVDLPGKAEREAAPTPVLSADIDEAFSSSGAPVTPREFALSVLDRDAAAAGAARERGGRDRGGRTVAAAGEAGAGAPTEAASGGSSGTAGGSGSGGGGGGGGLAVVGGVTGANPSASVGNAVGTVGGTVEGVTGAVGGATGAVEGATGAAGGATGAVGGATETVGGVVGGAGDKLPPPPASLPIEPPSLPPVPSVPTPVPGGGPSLP